jgi:uroporphyrinogen-III synthase
LIDRLRAPDFMPSTALAESLGSELGDISGRRVLFARGDLAGDTLASALRARGAVVDEIVSYRTVAGDGARELARLVREREVDAILFMSASSVRHLLDALGPRSGARAPGSRDLAVICIGAETARAALAGGLQVSAVANEKTASAMVAAVEEWFGREEDGERR